MANKGLYKRGNVGLLPYSRVWYELLTFGFVKVTSGYVKKAKPEPCLTINVKRFNQNSVLY